MGAICSETSDLRVRMGQRRRQRPRATSAELQRQLAQAGTPDQCCVELGKIFGVRPNEVALLRLENGLLKFLCPFELSTAGAIPISSSTAVAAHTVVTRKTELFNNFTRVKHASIFESIKPASEKGEELHPATIHKLMTAPILDKTRPGAGRSPDLPQGLRPGLRRARLHPRRPATARTGCQSPEHVRLHARRFLTSRIQSPDFEIEQVGKHDPQRV